MNTNYLKSWLTFNESVTADFITDNQWIAHGSPTISTDNAQAGNALQLDGDSYLETEMELGGSPFSIWFWVYVDEDTPENSCVLDIRNPDTGYAILQLFVETYNGTKRLKAYRCSYADASQDSGNNILPYSGTTTVGQKVHISLVQGYTDYKSGRMIYYVNDKSSRASDNSFYERRKYKITLGAFTNGNGKLIGSIDEFIIFDGKNYKNDTNTLTPEYYNPYTLTIPLDTQRRVTTSNKWRYENVGEINSLINTSTAGQLENLTAEQSRIGKAFYQTQTGIKLFDVPSSREIWAKFDVYYNGANRWRFYDISTDVANNKTTGITAQTTSGSNPGGNIRIYNISTSKATFNYKAKKNKLQTIILHMIADETDGLIEFYSRIYPSNVLVKLGEFTGSVNNGVDFSNLYLQSDGAGTFFSNVLISNEPLLLQDNAQATFAVSSLVDTERKIDNEITLLNDTSRGVYKAPNTILFDVERILLSTTISIDYDVDVIRQTENLIAISFDTERKPVSLAYLSVDAERVLAEGFYLNVDLHREVINVPIWRYENIGVIDDLLNVEDSAVQMDNVPLSQSWTGKAFYNGLTSGHAINDSVKMFPIPDTDRVWIKFDVYRPVDFSDNNNYGRFKVRDKIAVGVNDPLHGKSSMVHAASYGSLEIWDTVEVNALLAQGVQTQYIDEIDVLKSNERQTIIIHWQADAECGTFEIYTDDGGLVYTHYGMMHAGQPFKQINFSTATFEGLHSYFSNIVISNGKLDFDDNVSLPVSFSVDTSRTTGKTLQLNYDTQRITLAWSSNESFSLDVSRRLVCASDLLIDTERIVDHSFPASWSFIADVERGVVRVESLFLDIQRLALVSVSLAFDFERKIAKSIAFLADVARQVPYIVVVEGDETVTIPVAPAGGGLQSITIQIAEQQITDRVSFVHAGDCEIMDKIQGNYLDYNFDLRIEETAAQGVIQSCSCCTDIDEILYSQLAYTIPPDEWNWPLSYQQDYDEALQEDPELEKVPSATIEKHLETLAKALGKNLIYRGTTWYSTLETDEQGGKTYADVLSELVGWSARLPHMAINCYIRGGNMYAIQRGHEANTISLAGAKIANLKVSKKIVRTVWGSDAWSKTEVKTEPFTAITPDLGGGDYSPSSGSSTQDDNGLVETTTKETDTELSVTTYYYKNEGGGGKYLYKEVTEKYEREAGASWQYVDTITTTHDKVSANQSLISAVDSEGSILGSTVSQNNFDDRITPYEKGNSTWGLSYVYVNGQKVYVTGYRKTQEEQTIYEHTIHGMTLFDTSFPIYGDDALTYLTNQIKWLNRRTEETISLDVYDLNHVIGFNDKISYNDAVYYLRSNSVLQDERTVNKQSLIFSRWY